MDAPINPDWITPQQAAAEFRLSESSLRRWHKAGKLSRVTVGKQSFYRRNEIVRLIAIRKADKERKG